MLDNTALGGTDEVLDLVVISGWSERSTSPALACFARPAGTVVEAAAERTSECWSPPAAS